MTANPEPMVQQLQGAFQNLPAYVTGPGAGSQTVDTVELTLFRRLLVLGAAMLRLFLVTWAAARSAEPVTAPDGTWLSFHDQRPTTDDSVVGNVHFERQYFTAPGQEGYCPLEAELSWPARGYSTKKAAGVTRLSTMSPYECTPQEMVDALLRATVEGQAAAMNLRAQRVAQRDGPHIQPHVALTDGAEALPPQVVTHVPPYTFILDIRPATASRWDTAQALLGETPPHRLAWVHASLEPLLAGQPDAVITALEAEGHDPTHTGRPRQAVRRTVG